MVSQPQYKILTAEEEKQEWRDAFRRRLDKACHFLRGNERLNRTISRHLRSFTHFVSENDAYKGEISKLAPFELEILSIASTQAQLQRDLLFFSAEEVKNALMVTTCNEERRNEVRRWIALNGPELEHILTNPQVLEREEACLQNARDWIVYTFSSFAIQQLLNELNRALEQNSYGVLSTNSLKPGHPAERPSYEDCLPDERRRTDMSSQDPVNLTRPGSASVEQDSEDLLHIVYYAGARVPECLFFASSTWDHRGEETKIVLYMIPDVLSEEHRVNAAISRLVAQGLLIDTTALKNQQRFLTVSPEASTQLDLEDSEQAPKWKRSAMLALCRSFPRWPHAVPERSMKSVSLLPVLARVLVYERALEGSLSLDHQIAFAETCIAASYFWSLPWKQLLLRIASRVSYSPALNHSIRLRTGMVNRLLDDRALLLDTCPDPGSKISFAQQSVCEMRSLLDQQCSIQEIQKRMAMLNYMDLKESTQGRQIWIQAYELLAKAYKFHGKLAEAKHSYDEILGQLPSSLDMSVAPRFKASYAEILCETKDPDTALDFLRAELGAWPAPIGNRLGLAFAHAYLTKGLWAYLDMIQIGAGKGLHEQVLHRLLESYLQEAKQRYLYYRNMFEHAKTTLSIFSIYNHFSSSAGLAMAYHILALLASEAPDASEDRTRVALQSASMAWQYARDIARRRWKTPGFPR